VSLYLEGVMQREILRVVNNFFSEHRIYKQCIIHNGECPVGIKVDWSLPVVDFWVYFTDGGKRFVLPDNIVNVSELLPAGDVERNREVRLHESVSVGGAVTVYGYIVFPSIANVGNSEDYILPVPESWYPVLRHYVMYNLYRVKRYYDKEMYHDHFAQYKSMKCKLDVSPGVWREPDISY